MIDKDALKEELERKGWLTIAAEVATVLILAPICLYALVVILECAR